MCEEKPSVSLGRKIWDVLFPVVFALLALIITEIILLIIYSLIYKSSVPTSELTTMPGFIPIMDIVFYCICLFFLGKAYKRDRFRFGQSKNVWSVPKIVIAVAVIIGISLLIQFLMQICGLYELFPSYMETYSNGIENQSPVLVLIALAIVGPIAEEVIFRGLFYNRLKNYIGPKWAMLLSAAVFGLYHGNMIQFIYAFFIGLILAYYYEKSKSLLVPMIGHVAINLVSVILTFAL